MKRLAGIAVCSLFAVLLPAQTAPIRKPVETPTPDYRDLKFPPLREVKIPDIPTFTLANGIKLYLLENHELPLVGGFALVHTGSLFDPPSKVGLAEIMGSVMRTGGTKSKTGDQIDEEVENIAASVESGVSPSNGKVSFSCLRENTTEILNIFKDVLTAPEFRQEKIDLVKNRMRGEIARRNDDASGIAGREFLRRVYGPNSPYGQQTEYADLDNIQRADLVDFYKRFYFPANTVIAIQGDFDSADMKSKIENLFADWKVQQPPAPPLPKVTAKPAPGVFVADKSDVTQTFFNVGHLAGDLRDKNYPALEVMSDILGGGFSSRLFKKVRTQLGYAYNISSDWEANFDYPGVFLVSGSTKSSTTIETIQAIEQEIENIRTSEVTDDELKTAKDTALNSFVFNFDSPGKTLGRVVTYDYYGYPKDFIFQYQKAVSAVTKEDVLRVAKEYLRPKDLTIVAVGNTKEFDKPLNTLGTVTAIDLTIPEPKKPEIPVNAETIANGKALLARSQRSVGGIDKLAMIRDATEIADVDLQAGGTTIKARQTNMSLFPNQFRQLQQMPFGLVTVYSDGTAGWIIGPQGQMPMAPQVIDQVRMEIFRNFFSILLSDRDPNRTVVAATATKVEISDRDGHSVIMEMDLDGRPIKQQYLMSGSKVEETYSDWRDVNGIKMPFHIAIQQAGQKFADVTVREWKLNTGLKPEELGKRP